MKRNWKVDQLEVQLYQDAKEMSKAAASQVGKTISDEITDKGYARIILATGASQFDFLDQLQEETLDWSRITVFHLDEYKGISADHPASFRKYLRDRILDVVKPQTIHFIHGDHQELEKHLGHYKNLLQEAPIDLACIGFGENGHIAFNDPPVADFQDPLWIKLVSLDEDCRKQQLGEGWFPTLEDVPKEAITLTIPAIMACKKISCVVPDERKANAVYKALGGPIQTQCPASILRKHDNAILYLDEASGSLIT